MRSEALFWEGAVHKVSRKQTQSMHNIMFSRDRIVKPLRVRSRIAKFAEPDGVGQNHSRELHRLVAQRRSNICIHWSVLVNLRDDASPCLK